MKQKASKNGNIVQTIERKIRIIRLLPAKMDTLDQEAPEEVKSKHSHASIKMEAPTSKCPR